MVGELFSRTVRGGHRRPFGFTLIEVLVVVAIIALLISILLPSLTRAREQARAVACMSSLHQISLGLFTYQEAYAGSLPGLLWSEYDWYVLKKDLWFYKLRREISDPKIWVCAGDPFASKYDFDAMKGGQIRTNAGVPSCGYGMNYLLRHYGGWEGMNIRKHPPRRPQNTILLGEVGPDDQLVTAPLGEAANGAGQPWRDGGRLLWDNGARGWYSGPTWVTTRHMGGINFMTMDGSVHRARTVEMLQDVKLHGIRMKYDDCARGECYFCNYHSGTDATHYNFAPAKLWWWTGKLPSL